MRQTLYYVLKSLALVLKAVFGRDAYMSVIVRAHKLRGVQFTGVPRYLDSNIMLDPSGGLAIGRNVVISTNVIILTHDYSITTAMAAGGNRPKKDHAILAPVVVGDNCFLGAGVIVLPGTTIGKNVIIGAGSLALGCIPENSVVAGNPARVIRSVDSWLERKMDLPKGHKCFVDKD